VQRPTEPGWSHDTQAPPHATLQQILSTQKPEAQSSPVEQTALLALLPHLLDTHNCPAAQLALVEQA
jgi:hypothetical protein